MDPTILRTVGFLLIITACCDLGTSLVHLKSTIIYSLCAKCEKVVKLTPNNCKSSITTTAYLLKTKVLSYKTLNSLFHEELYRRVGNSMKRAWRRLPGVVAIHTYTCICNICRLVAIQMIRRNANTH